MAQTKVGVKKIRQKYGKDTYRKWGKLGGNPKLKVLTMLEALEKTEKEVANVSD